MENVCTVLKDFNFSTVSASVVKDLKKKTINAKK